MKGADGRWAFLSGILRLSRLAPRRWCCRCRLPAVPLGPMKPTILRHPAKPRPSPRNRGCSDAELNEFGIAAANATPIVDWTACGTCEWMIDGAGCLTIRPANGADSGELDAAIPWREYREKVSAVEVKGKVKAQTLKSAFFEMTNLVRADLSNLDTSSVSTMQEAFYGCESLTSLDLSNWDTSSVKNMFGMFAYCSSLESLDLSNWSTAGVTSMGGMFYWDSSLVSLNLSGWDTSSVTDMEQMFTKCTSLVSIKGLSSWDTSSVTSVGIMFWDCSSLASLDLSGWDTSKITHMYSMFYGCSSLTSVGDLSGWNASNVVSMHGLFNGCSSIKSLNLSSWDVSEANAGNLFNDCSSLRAISLSDSFAFTKGSDDSKSLFLPTPVGDGLSGKWVSSVDGKAYAPEEVPSNVAATYTAEGFVIPDPNPRSDVPRC